MAIQERQVPVRSEAALPTPSKAPKEAKEPKVPKYVRVLWRAVREVSDSAKIKMGYSRWIARLLGVWTKRRHEYHAGLRGLRGDPRQAAHVESLSHFMKAENLSCMAMCLTPEELEWLNIFARGLLNGDLAVERLHAGLNKRRREIEQEQKDSPQRTQR